MILLQIGLLKAESDLNRFQRRLESPSPPLKLVIRWLSDPAKAGTLTIPSKLQ